MFILCRREPNWGNGESCPDINFFGRCFFVNVAIINWANSPIAKYRKENINVWEVSDTKVSYIESKMYSSVNFRWTDPNCSKLVFTPPSGWFRLVAGEAIDHDNSSVPAPLSSQQRQRCEKNIDKSTLNRAHFPQRALNLKSCVLPIFLQEPLKHL